ncbi:MAG: hypothetical protein MPL62_12085 [Alphaproteobacteria bacterium]|nr:hypothetical protein [Alphaproteobacteria bacterium]
MRSLTRYAVKVSFEIGGVVEERDLVGALYGQTKMLGEEKCLGPSTVGRIDTQLQTVTSKSGKSETHGTSTLPMYADSDVCADIAACIEEINNVGPIKSKFTLESIIDVKKEKAEKISKRSREIREKWLPKKKKTKR